MRYIKLLGLALLAVCALASFAASASAVSPGVTQSATDQFVVQQTGVGESLKAAATDCVAFTMSTGAGLITTTTDTVTMLVSAPTTAVFDIGMQPLALLLAALLVLALAALTVKYAFADKTTQRQDKHIAYSSWRRKRSRSIRDAPTDYPATSPLARARQLFPTPAPVPIA